ncbi:HAD hydrolase-like protein [Terrarubrum flagellatum]|uniref:HAD hydrolase-like protein n=1 Tax=Terrirubrum flagellatum TaxID=2895980 RepID=UPI0031452961
MKQRTIIFDLDGTLVDTAPDLIVAINKTLVAAGHREITPSVLRPAMSFGARRMVEVGLAWQGVSVDSGIVDSLTSALLAHYADNVAVESQPYPYVREVLVELSERDAILCVCTNKMESLSRQLLAALHLEHHFKAICGRDSLLVSKPHPGHLIGTVERAGGILQRSIMIGDSEVDIATAKAACVPVVAIEHGYSDKPLAQLLPDALISDFSQLLAAIDAIG